MSKHTPGPWKARAAVQSNGPNYFAITDGKWGSPTIAQAYDEASARLISASPDLFEAAQRAIEAMRVGRPDRPSYEFALNALIEAVAKAGEGQV